ncbi:uncharacterized protein LOC131227129 [Magnolia sinica]|uniref:uncharacterized protein LOC131227129 n=1 Tax=Magnolia sinica TaxID=86752 RepID=UPI00265995C2|nr:uncharacterized protein LOC131227129 [Magnolia sinica]
MNSTINDLLAEEQRLQVLSQETSQGPSDLTLAVSTSASNCSSTHLTCRGCNKVGHVVAQCKDWCAYCRRTGHGIQHCHSRAYVSSFGYGHGGQGRGHGRALSVTFATTSFEPSVSDTASTGSIEGLSSPLTPAMLQQIVQALSAAGISVYVKPPSGSLISADKVCRLKKALYGLKQASRAWFQRFHVVVIGASFTQSGHDPSLSLRTTERGIVIVLVYVDDLLLIGSDDTGISALKKVLKSSFKIKDLGHLTYFLGLKFSRSIRGILMFDEMPI